MWKKLMIGALGLLVCGMVMGAAPSGPPLLRNEPSNVVDSGVVIAYGEWVSPPFSVVSNENGIAINGRAFLPRTSPRRADLAELTQKDEDQHQLLEAISEAYRSNRTTMGIPEAAMATVACYKDHPLLDRIIFVPGENLLRVGFADGRVAELLLSSYDEELADKSEIGRSQTNRNALMAKELERCLAKGWGIIFGEGYTFLVAPHIHTMITKVVDDILVGVTSREAAGEAFKSMLGANGEQVFMDITECLPSWTERGE